MNTSTAALYPLACSRGKTQEREKTSRKPKEHNKMGTKETSQNNVIE
jgi:hypothetical protein